MTGTEARRWLDQQVSDGKMSREIVDEALARLGDPLAAADELKQRARKFTWEEGDIKIVSVGPDGDSSMIEKVEPIKIVDDDGNVIGMLDDPHAPDPRQKPPERPQRGHGSSRDS